ncbi:MAG: LEA type 2 family protein [Gemmatimonadota bacterium]|nr:MAG: LEA type 2 family protein [Gemmatimonadota bacterium]
MRETAKPTEKRPLMCWFVLLGVLFLSCSGFRELAESAKVKRPGVAFAGANITGLSFENIDFMFDIRIVNPNPVGVKLAGFDYDFRIDDNTFVSGDRAERIEILAEGEHTVHLPLSIAFSSLYRAFQSLRDSDTSSYHLNCGFSFDVPILGPVRIPVSTKGDLPLLKLPRVNLEQLSLKHLDVTEADLELGVRVHNPNGFSMLLERFNYQFLINGQPWASGVVREKMEVSERSERLVSIPISLNFLQIGRSAYRMLEGDQAFRYELKGDFDVTGTLSLLEKVNLNFDRSGFTELIR